MDRYCQSPSLQPCATKIKAMGGRLPLVAVKDVSASSNDSEWRCFSPTCLTANGSSYRRGSHCREGCTRDAELAAVLQQCAHPPLPSKGRQLVVNVTDVWGRYADDCGMIRTPELLKTSTRLLLFGQCRHANASDSVSATSSTTESEAAELRERLGLGDGLGDNMLTVRIVTIESLDWGVTWGNISTVTAIARSVGVGVFDKVNKAVVFQYQSFTQTNPYAGNRLLQKTSTDEGQTWSKERDITSMIAKGCNSGPGGQVCGAAGSRIQTTSGRLLFSGHNKATSGAGTGICVWYSDDGGETYTVSHSGLFQGNEQSIADLGNGTLYMNGRGTTFPFKGHRASYWSHDNGGTWSEGECSAKSRKVVSHHATAWAAGSLFTGIRRAASDPCLAAWLSVCLSVCAPHHTPTRTLLVPYAYYYATNRDRGPTPPRTE
jgi:hypothetical protein